MRLGELQAVFDVVDELRLRHLEADLPHRIFEQQPVFGLLDGVDLRADQLDAVLVEHAGFGQLDRQIQAGLPADGREQRVGPLACGSLLRRTRRLSGST